MKFLHTVVFTPQELKDGDYDTGNWNDLTSGDYVVHALYSIDNNEVILLNDNDHAPY